MASTFQAQTDIGAGDDDCLSREILGRVRRGHEQLSVEEFEDRHDVVVWMTVLVVAMVEWRGLRSNGLLLKSSVRYLQASVDVSLSRRSYGYEDIAHTRCSTRTNYILQINLAVGIKANGECWVDVVN